MKKLHLYIILILVVVAFGLYIVVSRLDTSDIATVSPILSTQTASVTNPIINSTPTVAVTGMQQYTDSKFGFSFWYPTGWQVTVSTNAPFGVQTSGGTTLATFGLQPIGQKYPSIMVKEFHSDTTAITDTGGAGPIGPVTYFFDTKTHLWMTTSNEATGSDVTTPANISNNSMGGLHLFGGTSRFDTNIIPLSATNFVVISDGGASNATALAKTVVASDPTVGTPVSTAEQIQAIQAEQAAL